MILADTGIWIDHFRVRNPELAGLVENDELLCHPFVVGELALGSLRDRKTVLSLFKQLRFASVATPEEVLELIERTELPGSSVGYVDTHLLASVLITRDAKLWTTDRRLNAAAGRLGVSAKLLH